MAFEWFKRDYFLSKIMKIWMEALTGKQAMLVHSLALAFEDEGHEILITSRPYGIDRSNGNLDRLGRDHISIGKYGGASLKDKLVMGSLRIIELTKIVEMHKPDILISFPSPDGYRTAFGLGIPIIQINDTPHAEAVARLTVSLSKALIHAEAISSSEFAKFGATKFYPYKGVDEVIWINRFQPDKAILEKLSISKNKYLVIRCEESKAAYFQRMYPNVKPGSTIVIDLIKQLKSNNIDLDIVAFPRYPEQEEELLKYNVIIPEKSVDTLSLLYYAKGAMTAGGTMGREAALMGTPTIYSFPLELAVSTYIIERGFPLEHCPDHLEVPDKMIGLLNKPRMDERARIKLLDEMETPLDGIIKALNDLKM